MLRDLSIERVDLRVADVDAADGFYRRLLHGDPPVTFLEAGRPERSPRPAAGLFHVAFRFPTRAGLGGALQRLQEDGVPLTGASDHGVSEALYLDDPDGNGIELYWDRPREVWPEAMFTEPLPLRPLLDMAEQEPLLDIGHVHYKASDLAATTRFWLDLGLEQTAALLDQASFLAADGYHHHVGANNWFSRGKPPQPPELPGLDRVVLRASGAEPGEREEPNGTIVELVA